MDTDRCFLVKLIRLKIMKPAKSIKKLGNNAEIYLFYIMNIANFWLIYRTAKI